MKKGPKTLKKILRLCQKCGHMNESSKELERCLECTKWFLPMNYATALSTKNTADYKCLFKESEDLELEDTIKGITAIWD